MGGIAAAMAPAIAGAIARAIGSSRNLPIAPAWLVPPEGAVAKPSQANNLYLTVVSKGSNSSIHFSNHRQHPKRHEWMSRYAANQPSTRHTPVEPHRCQ